MKNRPSTEELHRLLTYNPLTGSLKWNVDIPYQGIKPGDEAGTQTTRGYVIVGIAGEQWLGHVIAWCMMTGTWPDQKIDHKNTIRTDNRWSNLRLASDSQNAWNRGMSSNNTSGHKNVSWSEKHQKWQASVSAKNVLYYLGHYRTLEAAVDVTRLARERLHGKFANHADNYDSEDWLEDWVDEKDLQHI